MLLKIRFLLCAKGSERCPVGMRAGREADARQRSRRQRAVMDRQTKAGAIIRVEIGMGLRERCHLTRGRRVEAGDIMMAVTLGVGKSKDRKSTRLNSSLTVISYAV